uniref:Uncharacterized protein n=1 Tax=Phenylobacterium glaciei TaxID=2803784 RepID=A0A974P729_9CAUL|nr:hypothetical protein JKL49_11580 [Phenylobacterium glaciei]
MAHRSRRSDQVLRARADRRRSRPLRLRPATALPGRPTELAPGLDSDLIATRLERFSKPTDFWKRFSPDLTNAPDVQVLLNAPLTGVRLTLDGASVDHLEVRRPDGGSWRSAPDATSCRRRP